MLACERAKIDLSTESTAVARKAELVPERHLSLEEEITRAEYERAIMPLIVKSGTAIEEALKLRGMRPKDIDKVLLVGGSSKIPLVKRYVSEKLAGKEPEPFDKVDPMTCVAQGAAIVSAILQGARASTTMLTASSSSIRSVLIRSISGRIASFSTRSSSAAPTFPARSTRCIIPSPTRPIAS